MAKIKTIEELRDHLLNTIEKLDNDQINLQDAAITGKLCDDVLHTIKVQMEYAKMKNQQEQFSMPFMDGGKNNRLIDGDSVRFLNDKKKLK
jgi:hypothetical protein